MRRFLAILFVMPALGAGPAAALDRPSPAPGLNELVTTAHFIVHYTTLGADAVQPAQAQTLAANAEQAYAIETSWGLSAPKDDGDGRTDIYVFNGRGTSYTQAEQLGPASTAYIAITPMNVVYPPTIRHELFHVLQLGIDVRAGGWLLESSAHWAEHEIDPQQNVNEGFYLVYPQEPLDCVLDGCGTTVGDRGYNRWLFWSYLVHAYGYGIVRDVFETGLAAQPTAALDAALMKHGSSLARAYADFAVANLLRSYPGLNALAERVPQRALAAGTATSITVAHLATTYLALQRPAKACTTTILHVRVALPPAGGGATLVVGKAIVGSGAAIDTTWKTCQAATLVLSNTSLVDGQTFAVQSSTGRR